MFDVEIRYDSETDSKKRILWEIKTAKINAERCREELEIRLRSVKKWEKRLKEFEEKI